MRKNYHDYHNYYKIEEDYEFSKINTAAKTKMWHQSIGIFA